ncbi:hypothetical protein FRC11_005392 [Ceratobasidium sp. 423]|nr:hypothetical protein FRC11_005392 [Ceratobasidium sp. 423]
MARAPNLESLKLVFAEPKREPEYELEPDLGELEPGFLQSSVFFYRFLQARFPKLRSFTITIESDRADPLDFRAGLEYFIQAHPQLQEVLVTLVQPEKNYLRTPRDFMPSCRHITSNNISTLMPSVRHFEGPSMMCEALLGSPLAERIENLGVVEPSCHARVLRTGQDLDMLPRLAAGDITLWTSTLPQLKRFQVIFDKDPKRIGSEWQVAMTALISVVAMMPNLGELVIQNTSTRKVEIGDLRLLVSGF